MHIARFMHILLAFYTVALVLDRAVSDAMSDPEAALRESCATHGVLAPFGHEAYQAEVDAGRAALKVAVATLPSGAVPPKVQAVSELWQGVFPPAARIYSHNPVWSGPPCRP